MTIKDLLKKILIKSVKIVTKSNFDMPIEINIPEMNSHGDFSSSIAMQIATTIKQNPREVAKDLIENIEKNDFIEKIEIAGAGFINFFISKKEYKKRLLDLFNLKNGIGKSEELKGKTYIIEHTDPNLFKELHIGHIMTNTIGESLYRLFTFAGANTKNVTFQGDVGLHIAKALWGIMSKKVGIPKDLSLYEKQKFLGACYQAGEKHFNSSEESKKEIIEINKNIYSKKNINQNKIYEEGCSISLQYFESIYKKLGSKFDYYFLESNTFKEGLDIVKKNIGEVFKYSDKTVIFEGSKHGYHDRVFINKEGLPTYEAKDIGLFYQKWKKYNPDYSLTITGAEQDQYFKTVREAAGLINPEWKNKTFHKAHGILKLKNGKMSSRKGEIIRAEEWVSDLKKILIENMQSKNYSKQESDEISEKIAIASIKYSILKVSSGKDIVYDQDTSLSFTGNTGPYLQYSLVRALSILKKAGDINIEEIKDLNTENSNLEKQLHNFFEVLDISRTNLSSHYLADYLYNLSKTFNAFYESNRFLDKNNNNYIYNLAVVFVFSNILKNGLYCLGIHGIDRM